MCAATACCPQPTKLLLLWDIKRYYARYFGELRAQWCGFGCGVMRAAKFWVFVWSIALSVLMGYFMFKFSGRDLAPDWVRPSLSVIFAFLGVILLIKLGRTRIAAFMHFVVGFGTSLFITLMYLYYRSIDAVFTGDDVVAIAQSNPEEVWDFLSHYILNPVSLISSLVLLVGYYLLFKAMYKLWRPDNQAPLFAPYSRRALGLLRIKAMGVSGPFLRSADAIEMVKAMRKGFYRDA